MRSRTFVARLLTLALAAWVLGAGSATAQAEKPFVPEEGQPGKDVVWVPTPPALVDMMLDMAEITPEDFLIDLGAGDGRIVIAAARRGTPALGIEYSIRMVDLAGRNADAAGLRGLARFEWGDMFEADISKATVMALFLLPGNLAKLRDKFMTLAPGSRIVSNEYAIEGWEVERRETLPDCDATWCTALLYIVPAKVDGTWQTAEGDLVLRQQYQRVSGSLGEDAVTGGMRGAEITLTAGDSRYVGRVNGNVIEGTVTRGGSSSPWRATRR